MPERMKKPRDDLKLLRHQLGVIDFADIETENEKVETEAERRAYCGAIHAVWPRLEKDIRKLMYAQLLFGAKQAETWEQVVYSRGALAGMESLFELWASAHHEFQEKATPEEFDKYNIVPELNA